MMRRRACCFTFLLLLILAACGDDTREGVTLRGPQGQSAAPSPTAADSASDSNALPGRLLYLKGRQFQVLDLQSGETTSFENITANSSPAMNTDETRGVFVAFPNFGLIDLSAGTSTTIPNTGTNPNGFDISPDGRWMITLTGGIYRVQMRLISLDGSAEPVNIATESNAFYRWAWTPDSRLVWWDVNDPGTITILDPATGDSSPAGNTALELASYPFAAVSPDGTRMAAISPFDMLDPGTLLFNLPAADGTTAPERPTAVCADSVIELYPLPLPLGGTIPAPEPIWTEPDTTASSPEWLDDDSLLFVKVGSGSCGQIEGDPQREIMLLDIGTDPRPIAGPIGNADDRNDEEQFGGLLFGHLYDASPDEQYIAWIAGNYASGETMINVTTIETGETQTVIGFTVDDALGGKPDFLENYLIRGVTWLE